MFTVNRKDGASKYIDTEGTHLVSIAKCEAILDGKGREIVTVTFKRQDGAAITDRFINQENVWWRVNSLVAATDHNVPDGTQVDFLGVKGSFLEFLTAMIGLELAIVTKFEDYTAKDGTPKKAVRVRSFRNANTVKPVSDLAGEEDAGEAAPW
jgi:hypothetical protein